MWIRVRGSEAVLAGSGTYTKYPTAIAGGDPGLVIVGYSVEELTDVGISRNAGSAAWYSPDGFAWTETTRQIGGSGKQWMHAVIAGGPGFVAVGEYDEGGDTDASVWTSPDGLRWEQVWTGSGDGDQHMHAVIAGGPGFVAVGNSYPEDAAVWVSSDGTHWDRVADDSLDGPGQQQMFDVAAGGPGLVAVGFDETADGDDGAVWTSPDGFTWSRVPDPERVLGGPGSQKIYDIAAGGSGFVALGVDDAAPDDVWASPDGRTWERQPGDRFEFRGPNGVFGHLVTGGPGLATLGYEPFEGSFVWVGAPCTASEELIALLGEHADGVINDSACDGIEESAAPWPLDVSAVGTCEALADAGIALHQWHIDQGEAFGARAREGDTDADVLLEESARLEAEFDAGHRLIEDRANALGCGGDDLEALLIERIGQLTATGTVGWDYIDRLLDEGFGFASPCGAEHLDDLYEGCAGGDMAACDDLYRESPVGSECRVFGATCGGTTDGSHLCAGPEDDGSTTTGSTLGYSTTPGTCPPGTGHPDCYLCGGVVPCTADCEGVWDATAGMYVSCRSAEGEPPICYCPYQE